MVLFMETFAWAIHQHVMHGWAGTAGISRRMKAPVSVMTFMPQLSPCS